MNLEQLRAWLDSHGGYKDSIPTTQQKVNPLTKLSEDQQVTVMVAADGSQITVRGTGQDTYEVVGEPKLATPAQAGAAAGEKQIASRQLETNPATGRQAWHITYRDGSDSWDESGVPASATAADKPGQKTTIENGEVVTREIGPNGEQGRIISQKPATKAEIEAVQGPQGTAAANRKPVPGKPGIYEVTNASKDPNGNSITETHYEDEAGNRVPTPGAEGATGSNREPVPGKPGVYKVTNQTKDAQGNATSETHFEDAQGNRVETPTDMPKTLIDLPNGSKGQLVPNPDEPGTYKAVPVPGTEGNKTAVPTIDVNAKIGEVTAGLKKQWDEKYVPLIQSGQLTQKDALDQFDRDRAIAQASLNEQIAQLNAGGTIRGQDVTQRGQSLQSVENQRSNMTSVYRDTMNQVLSHPAPGGLEAAQEMMRNYANLQKQMGIPMGVPSDQPYAPAQQQIMGREAPAPIVFNINAGGGVMPSSPLGTVGQQMGLGAQPAIPPVDPGPPTSVEQIVNDRRDPTDPFWDQAVQRVGTELQQARSMAQSQVPPGMNVSGGQLRAPGVGPVGGGPVSSGPVGRVG